jgi:hypothetical protein
MIVGYKLDGYIIYAFLSKVATKSMRDYIIIIIIIK